LQPDPSGGPLHARQGYYPYGETRYTSGPLPTDFGFTGQRSEGFGLYDYHARYYSPALGRFISADTLVPNPDNPQDFNRYAYVRNTPLKFIDPTGHYAALEDNDYWFWPPATSSPVT
jgi:RHS repeat-associated protein